MQIGNAYILTGESFQKGGICFSERITGIGELPGKADMDAGGGYIIPGLMDIHTHGALGEDHSDGSPEGLRGCPAGMPQTA